MILAFDCSTAACTAALFAADGALLSARDEVIGRGHAERLVPMVEEMLAGRVPTEVVVGVGPGSFTGLRVAIAAAHGLAIGWDAALHGMLSLALLAATAAGDGAVAVALAGGHGELFVQSFDRWPLLPIGEAANLDPSTAGSHHLEALVVGSGATSLVEARGNGDAQDLLPSAAYTLRLPEDMRRLPPRPLYVRAPDARPKAA